MFCALIVTLSARLLAFEEKRHKNGRKLGERKRDLYTVYTVMSIYGLWGISSIALALLFKSPFGTNVAQGLTTVHTKTPKR